MSYAAVPTVSTGDAWTATLHNKYIRMNQIASIPDILEAKGDIIAASAADAGDILPVGTDKSYLTAASGQTLGLKWGGWIDGIVTGSWETTAFWDDATDLLSSGVFSVDLTDTNSSGFAMPSGMNYVFGVMGAWMTIDSGSPSTELVVVLTTSSDTTNIYCESHYFGLAYDFSAFICPVDENKIILGIPALGARVKMKFWGYI